MILRSFFMSLLKLVSRIRKMKVLISFWWMIKFKKFLDSDFWTELYSMLSSPQARCDLQHSSIQTDWHFYHPGFKKDLHLFPVKIKPNYSHHITVTVLHIRELCVYWFRWQCLWNYVPRQKQLKTATSTNVSDYSMILSIYIQIFWHLNGV